MDNEFSDRRNIVSLLKINLGNNYRTDCQSERQTQDLHEVVLTLLSTGKESNEKINS